MDYRHNQWVSCVSTGEHHIQGMNDFSHELSISLLNGQWTYTDITGTQVVKYLLQKKYTQTKSFKVAKPEPSIH